MLTKKQLKEIEEVIKKRFLAFTYEALGDHVLTEEEIAELKRAGLLRESVRHFTGDGYTLGRILAAVGSAEDLSYADVLSRAKTLKPMTEVERAAIDWASTHAGQYIRGLGDDMVKEITAGAARTAGAAIRAVQNNVATAIRNRETTSQLQSELFHAFTDAHRDWQRVASTELHEAVQRGLYGEIAKNHGADQLVYKRPNPEACKYCKKVYLHPDGTPKVFRLKDLHDTNFGKRAAEWGPVIGAVHPWCGCQLQVIPEGYDFVRGKDGAIRLEHTGTTATPVAEKSFHSEEEPADESDNCTCGY